MEITLKVRSFFSGEDRSVKAKKNILASFAFKGVSVAISLVLVPLTLHYLNATEYGIWLTLSSVLTWINFFDIGLGNGLRNKLAEALASGDKEMARVYVSTTFALLFSIMLFFFVLFIGVQPFLTWAKILNTNQQIAQSLAGIMIVVFAFFCLQFVFKFIGVILLADQKPALNDLIGVAGSLLSLIIIYILTRTTHSSLLYVALTFSASPVLIFFIAYPVLFYGRYRFLRPALRCVNFKYSKSLMGLGVKFFIIQISCLVLFASSNLIIAQLFGAKEVTPYNIAFKYFNVIIMVFNIVLTPMWSAYTEAYVKNDLPWIKRATMRMVQLWAISSLGAIAMVFVADFVYRKWVGDEVKVPFSLTALTALYVIISNWNNIFSQMIAGLGKVYLQLVNSFLNMFIYVFLALYLGKSIGLPGIMLAMCLTLLTSSFWQPVQCWKLVNNKAKGLWNK